MRSYIYIVIAVVSLGLGIQVRAADVIDQSSLGTSGNIEFWSRWLGQRFYPQQDNISGISIYSATVTPTTTLSFYLCKGTPDNAHWADSALCNYGDAQSILIFNATSTDLGGGEFFYKLPMNVGVVASSSYYFSVKSYYASSTLIWNGTGADGYGFNTGYTPNGNLSFKEYYNDQYIAQASSSAPSGGGVSFIEHNYPFLFLDNEYYCKANESCSIDFTFNGYANSKEITFYQAADYGDSTPVPPALASTTLSAYAYGTSTVSIPYSASWEGKQVPMCAFIHDPTGAVADRLQCGWQIWWFSPSQQAQINDLTNCDGSYNIGSACNDIATSSGSFADDFRYGGECFVRRASYWMFTRSDESCVALFKAMNSLSSDFPFNVYNQVKDNAYQLISQNGTTSTSTLRVPLMVWQKGSGGMVDSGVDLFNAHIIQDKLGSAWTDLNDKLSMLVYFIGFIWFIVELVGLKDEIYNIGESMPDNSRTIQTGQRIANKKPVDNIPAYYRKRGGVL